MELARKCEVDLSALEPNTPCPNTSFAEVYAAIAHGNAAGNIQKAKAELTGKPVEELVTELVLGSLENDERYQAAARAGSAEADAGKLGDFDDAMDRVTAKLTRMKAGR